MAAYYRGWQGEPNRHTAHRLDILGVRRDHICGRNSPSRSVRPRIKRDYAGAICRYCDELGKG